MCAKNVSVDTSNDTAARMRAIGKIGGSTTHARHGGEQMTAPARRAFLAKFEQLVDPDNLLPIAERQKRADSARRAHFARMALSRHAKRPAAS